MVSKGQLQRQFSGTPVKTSSVLLEQTTRLIAENHGAHPTTDSLENAIRNCKKLLLLMGGASILSRIS